MRKLIERRGQVGLALAILALLAGGSCAARTTGGEGPSPTPTPEPLVPTATPAAHSAQGSVTEAVAPALPATCTPSTTAEAHDRATVAGAGMTSDKATPSPVAASTVDPRGLDAPTLAPEAEFSLPQGRDRFGVGVALRPISDYPVEEAGLGIGWYLNWAVRVSPAHPGGAAFWQMVQVSESGYRPDAGTIRAAAAANPGSFWIIGNEPDVRWQDNTAPERYAELYHKLYGLLKSADPTCRVVIGGVAQPTPLRLEYLDRVLAAYRARYGAPMPVDVWNVHGFILREERDSWGVDIPPGLAADVGVLYEIEDHDDLDIFRRQILAFRRWMADHGERDKPLVVSEYGILMPTDYGFDAATVQAFMEGSFDFFLTATDDAVGYPEDGNRLVQWWCWYSLAAPLDYYPTGNLFDPVTKALTPLGAAFAAYSPP